MPFLAPTLDNTVPHFTLVKHQVPICTMQINAQLVHQCRTTMFVAHSLVQSVEFSNEIERMPKNVFHINIKLNYTNQKVKKQRNNISLCDEFVTLAEKIHDAVVETSEVK